MFSTVLAPVFDWCTDSFEHLLWVSAISSAVVLVVLLFHLTLSRFLHVRWLYAIWLLVALRFALFVVPESPTSFLNLFREAPAEMAAVQTDFTDGTWSHFDAPMIDNSTLFPNGVPTITKSSLLRSVFQTATSIWIIGMAFLALRICRSIVATRKIVLRSTQPSKRIQRLHLETENQMGLSSVSKVRATELIATPALAGIFRPVILIPHWCERELDDEQLRLVFAHELTHLRRRDAFVQIITHLVAVVHWFNPLAWLTLDFLEKQRELACDASVVTRYRKSIRGTAKKYGQTILQIATRTTVQTRQTRIPPVLIDGFTGTKNSLIRQRIAMLTTKPNYSAGSLICAISCSALLLLAGFTAAQTAEPAASPETILPQPQAQTRQAASPVIVSSVKQTEPDSSTIVEGSSTIFTFEYSIPEIMVADPEIVSVTPISPSKLVVKAIDIGKTDIHVTNTEREIETLQIKVIPNIESIRGKLAKEFTEADIVVTQHEAQIVLAGNAPEDQIDTIVDYTVEIAPAKTKVVNRLSVNRFVAIEAKIYELDVKKFSELGVDFAGMLPKTDESEPNQSFKPKNIREVLNRNANPQMLASSTSIVKENFLLFMEALEPHAVAKLLDRPTLVTVGGKSAQFLNGGEVPITTEDADGKKSIEFRSFGTKLDIRPLVRSEEEILIQVKAELSELAEDLSHDGVTPGFRVRRANFGAILNKGESVVIAMEPPKANGKNSETIMILTPRILAKVTEKVVPPIEEGKKYRLSPRPSENR